jgi:hypothetical protein
MLSKKTLKTLFNIKIYFKRIIIKNKIVNDEEFVKIIEDINKIDLNKKIEPLEYRRINIDSIKEIKNHNIFKFFIVV